MNEKEKIQDVFSRLASTIRSKTSSVDTLTPEEMITEVNTLAKPSGTLSITENGTYDCTNYASAEVDVSGGGGGEVGHNVTVTIEDTGSNGASISFTAFYADNTSTDHSISTKSTRSVSLSNVIYLRFSLSQILVSYDSDWRNPKTTDDGYVYYKIQHDDTVLNFSYCSTCLLKGTRINIRNMQFKNIEDIDYNDDILVWNFDDCKLDYAKPMWIKKGQFNTKYWINKFQSGKIIKTTGTVAGHRFFNADKNKFLYNTECIGDNVYTLTGKDKLIECKLMEEKCEFYNVYTNYHMNLFAEGILTGYRYCNLYPINNMKYIKSDKVSRSKEEFNIPDNWYYGMRCSEQTDTVDNIRKYVLDREMIKK